MVSRYCRTCIPYPVPLFILGIFCKDYEEDEDDDDDDEDDTGMGDEGEDSNEGTGSADGNDGYEADDAEVTATVWTVIFFRNLLATFQEYKSPVFSEHYNFSCLWIFCLFLLSFG